MLQSTFFYRSIGITSEFTRATLIIILLPCFSVSTNGRYHLWVFRKIYKKMRGCGIFRENVCMLFIFLDRFFWKLGFKKHFKKWVENILPTFLFQRILLEHDLRLTPNKKINRGLTCGARFVVVLWRDAGGIQCAMEDLSFCVGVWVHRPIAR